MKKILIIGSKGFIGNSCFNYFRKKFTVAGCDVVAGEGSDYYCISDGKEMAQVISQQKFDVCINASGSAHVSFSFLKPEKDYELNVKNVQLILDAIRLHNPECKFINFSSAAVYGNPHQLPVSEKAETSPLSPYGKHKLESEALLKSYSENYQLKTASLRVFSAYGPGLRKQLFWDIFQKSLNKSHINLFGTGNESRDFIFIEDLLRVIEVVVAAGNFNGEVYNVASGIEITINSAARTFLESLGKEYSLEFTGEEKAGDPLNWLADISLIRSLGFTPAYSLEKGLQLTAQDYLAHQTVNGR